MKGYIDMYTYKELSVFLSPLLDTDSDFFPFTLDLETDSLDWISV